MRARDSKERFSDRVADYVRWRPSYPALLKEELGRRGIGPGTRVADIGSGTGISTKLFLENGNVVYGVEPNAKMRKAAEEFLSAYPKFHSVDGTSTETTLDEASIDIVTAAQAFHWSSLRQLEKNLKGSLNLADGSH